MVSGMLAVLTLAAGVVGPNSGPDKLAQRYRVNVEIKQEVDLTAAGAGPQVADVTGIAFLSVTMSDTTDGKLAHVVVDSMTVSATGQLAAQFAQSMADSLRGAWMHGHVVDGKLSGPPKLSVQDNPAMAIAMAGMNALFPGVTSKATGGTQWADTTRSDVSTDQGTQNTQQVVTWTVTSRDGAAISLTSSGTGTVSADMAGQQISGTISSSSTVTSPVGGPATAATVTSTQELSVLAPSLPEPIPVKVTSSATLTALP